MKLLEWLRTKRGRGVSLASGIDVSPVLISQWAGERTPPIERCVPIELATDGEVTRRDLRPADWGDIWPELVNALHPWPPVGDVIKPDSAVPLNITTLADACVEVDVHAITAGQVHAANDDAAALPLGRA